MNISIKKRDKSPDFVLGSGGFKPEDLKEYINSKGYINFDLLKGKESGYYLKISDYDTPAANKKEDEVIPF